MNNKIEEINNNAYENKAQKLWKHFENGKSYQQALGIATQIPQNIDFLEGRQWAKATPKTEILPRPVINIIKMIIRNKKAGINGSKVKLVFNSEGNKEYSEKITAFNDYIEKEMEMNRIRKELIDDAIKKGSGFIHYYWDNEVNGAKGLYETGGIRAELIDPLNIFFSNPNETDEQKQKWILIVSRVDVKAVQNMAQDETDKLLISPDKSDGTTYNEEHEQTDSDLCTLLTRYFKKDGEVYYERSTQNVYLHDPRALTPDNKEIVNSDSEDAAETESPDDATESEKSYKATLFPIVAYSYEKREKSIYGISEIEGIIPNQKSINFNYGMQLLSVQNLAWGKILVKDKALKGQQITNVPGEVLTDYTPGINFGIKRLDEQPFSSMPIKLAEDLITNTRIATGSTEVVTGEQVSANQSGAAIAQLQSQALKPIEDLRDNFWQACVRGGKVVEQFYKLFYENKSFKYTKEDEPKEDTFNGEEFQDIDFGIAVEAGAGTQFSESLTILLLDNLMQSQMIDFTTYIELYPDSAMPFKSTLKLKIKEREASENTQLKATLEQTTQQTAILQKQLEQAVKMIQEQQSITQQAAALVTTVDELKQQLTQLKIEGATKILAQNDALQSLSLQNAQTQQDATKLAQMNTQTQQDATKLAQMVSSKQ